MFKIQWLFFLVVIGGMGCAAPQLLTKEGQIPPDFRNDHLPVVQQYDQLKRDAVFKNAFEKKAEVCPLCQF